jgi:hypothetical protein
VQCSGGDIVPNERRIFLFSFVPFYFCVWKEKPLPYLLSLAYENHRILLIHWTRPAPLETFLAPPKGGFDWRATDELAQILKDDANSLKFMIGNEIRQYAADTNLTLLRTRLQTDKAGQNDYDVMIHHERDDDEPTFDQVFAPLWRIFFRPSKAVEEKIQHFLTGNQLIPGNYVACHLRALYGIESRPDPDILRLTEHAVNCSTQIRPAHPIDFASDCSTAAQMAKKYIEDMGGTRLVVNSASSMDPPHLDLDRDWKKRDPTYYFGTFVDLYMISLAGCVAFSEGGFGQWGLLIGGNLTCQINSKTRRVDDSSTNVNGRVLLDAVFSRLSPVVKGMIELFSRANVIRYQTFCASIVVPSHVKNARVHCLSRAVVEKHNTRVSLCLRNLVTFGSTSFLHCHWHTTFVPGLKLLYFF